VRLLKVNFCLSGYVFNDRLAVGFVRELVGGEEGEGERLLGGLMLVMKRGCIRNTSFKNESALML
jgi:hypothetical protein